MEYALVSAAFICLLVAGGALWRRMEAGQFVQHALSSASHHVQAAAGWIADVFSF